MALEGYVDYKRREFCNDIKCEIQLKLNSQKEGTDEHGEIRNICKNDCRYTTYQFHHWLIDKGYLLIRPE